MAGLQDSKETAPEALLTKETVLFLCPLSLTDAFNSLYLSPLHRKQAGKDRKPVLSTASGSELQKELWGVLSWGRRMAAFRVRPQEPMST